MRQTKTIEGFQFQDIDFDAFIRKGEPCIFKGALSDCALVTAAKQSDEAAMSYLRSFDSQKPLFYYNAKADADTRFFYTKEMDGFNYATSYASVTEFFDSLMREKQKPSGDSFYVGSAELEDHFPDLLNKNELMLSGDVFEKHPASIGIWLGNRTTAVAHYDVSNNIAASVVGRRRFTLFPPEQLLIS